MIMHAISNFIDQELKVHIKNIVVKLENLSKYSRKNYYEKVKEVHEV